MRHVHVHSLEFILLVIAGILILRVHSEPAEDMPEIVVAEVNDVNDVVRDLEEIQWQVEGQQSLAEQALHMARKK